MGLKDTLKGMISRHPDKADQAVEKGGDAVDRKTGGKHADKVDAAQDKSRDVIDRMGDEPPGQGPGQAPGQQPGQAPPGQPPPGQEGTR